MAEDKNEYTFMKEVIKEKRPKKGRILKKILGLIGSGIILGVIAAFIFAKVLPCFLPEEETSKVEFPDDEYEDLEDSEPKDQQNEDENKDENEDEQQAVSSETLSLDGFRQVYQDIVDVANEAERAIVMVQGITSEVDWMNNSYENKKQVSGVLVADNGKYYFVVTEYRVVENVERIMVTFSNGNTALAEFVKQDSGTGLAVLKIDKKDVQKRIQEDVAIAELGSSWKIERGETVIAIGSPTGYSGSIAYGMVTSTNNVKATTDTQYHLLTTDILGDSEGSGVLISLDGKIIGVMVQTFSMENEQNVLTAIPVSEVKPVIEKLVNNENLTYLGILGQDISNVLSANTGIPKGIYINSVEEESPAMQAGIQNGDVIVGVGETPIETLRQLRTTLNLYEKGDKITVKVMRKGANGYVEIVFDVTVGAL